MRNKRAKQLRKEAALVFFNKIKTQVTMNIKGKVQTFKNFYRNAKRFYNLNKAMYN